ncbi:MAG TPA: ATP-binding protein [Candidatus Babeliales bacterium]|nr:ATP-binding protein [Candidatus Babeliales bacterium]
MKKQLGTILSGSFVEGFLMRICAQEQFEKIKTGKFVSIVGQDYTFFSLITDLRLEVSNPDILLFPPSEGESLLVNALKKKDIYATAQLKPMLMVDVKQRVMPVKTIPPHFAHVHDVDESEVALIFGDENHPEKKFFNVGTPLDMHTPVCLNLEKLTERSNGIFGKTGTGKTFITRLVLAGLIKNEKAVNLVFDMHSEYGLQARQEQTNANKGLSFVKGLKTLFPDKVVIFSLDPESTRRRGSMPDVVIDIPLQSVRVEDIMSLGSELNLHSTAMEAAYLIAALHKENWLVELLSHGEDIKEFATTLGAHPESIGALYRKLKRIERLPFFSNKKTRHSVIDQMLEYIDRGKHVIIEFGNHTSTFCYLLIANIITRRIHQQYMAKTEKFLGSQNAADEPKKLMITIEEAHKFLNPQAAHQTIFGTIAREMRKYYVSLLVVDQRPSGIDAEILSQIGTKIVAQLSDEKDIQGVLTGINNAQQLRGILSSLDSKKQVLLLGHAVAMPVVVETRTYDEKFYEAMGDGIAVKKLDEVINEIF